MSSGLPSVQVPLPFLPTFNFLQKLRICYFHRLLVKQRSQTFLRIIAVTSSGDLGLFHIDGSRRGTLNLQNELEGVSFNNRYVFLEVTPNSDVEEDNEVLTLDFDTSSALVKGNETTEVAIRRFLSICHHFGRGIPIKRAGTLEQQRQASAANFQPLAPTQREENTPKNDSIVPSEPGRFDTPTKKPTGGGAFPSFSLRRKSAGSTFQKLFSGFSGVWSGSKEDEAKMKAQQQQQQMMRRNNNPGFSSDDDDNNNNNPSQKFGSSNLEQEDPDATVSVDHHNKQRKKMNLWREEVLSRMGEREGVDAKERILDDLARLEGSLKKQQALIESPPLPSDEEELVQQRALAALVMFICRRRSMLAEARATIIPQIRPKVSFTTSPVPNSVPVLPSYTDAFRSQFLG